MRQTQKGLDALRVSLTAAESALEEARKQVLDGTRPTVDALAQAEGESWLSAEEETRVSRELGLLSREIGEAERVLEALCRRRAKAEADWESARARLQECNSRVSSLTARLVQEQDVAVPLLKTRQHDVDRLSHRIRVREAHREARLSVLFPSSESSEARGR